MTNTASTTKQAETTINPTATLSSTHQAFFQYMADKGTIPSTLKTYRRDWGVIEDYFGGAKKLINILPVHIAGFAKSEALNEKADGNPKAQRTIDKTARVFRMFINFCLETGRISKNPIPKGVRLGRLSITQRAARMAKREAKGGKVAA